MKFGQLIEFNKKSIFLEKPYKNVQSSFCFFKKALFEVEASGLQLVINIYTDSSQLGTQSKQTANRLLIQRYA